MQSNTTDLPQILISWSLYIYSFCWHYQLVDNSVFITETVATADDVMMCII